MTLLRVFCSIVSLERSSAINACLWDIELSSLTALVECMSIECRKTKTKVITTANQNKGIISMRANENSKENKQAAGSAGKQRVTESRLAFVCIRYVGRLARVFWTNHSVKKANPTQSWIIVDIHSLYN